MNRTDAIAWVLIVCAQLRLSRAKTLAELAGAALQVGRVSPAATVRRILAPAAAKHRIKHTWRFVANPRIDVSDAMHGVVDLPVIQCKKPPLVGLDEMDFRGSCALLAAAGHPYGGTAGIERRRASRADKLKRFEAENSAINEQSWRATFSSTFRQIYTSPVPQPQSNLTSQNDATPPSP